MSTVSSVARRGATCCAAAVVAILAAACSGGGSNTGGATPHSTTSAPGTPAPSASTPAPGASPSATGAATVTACATAALRVTTGQSQGAAGTSYTNIDFTNVSGATCTLRGYPGVSLVTAGSSAGTQIGAAARRMPTTPIRTITLAPGKVAHATLGVVDAGNYSPSSCKMVTAHWLKVFPPNQYTAAYLPFTTQTCSLASQKTLIIQAVSPGA
ncbi:MAG: DUF4232 domain-containing protein [Streptosporangiaceae bacterium]